MESDLDRDDSAAPVEPPARSDRRALTDALRTETVGGAILLVAASLALVWANLPVSGVYEAMGAYVPYDGDLVLGPLALHLDLSVAAWAADGLLAIFFFVVGLELKRELLAGSLRNPARAALPVAAAVGGMVVPALVYALVVLLAGDTEVLSGWGVPVATDIAFALAVLAVLSSHLPMALRVFLLTLAVVDDLLAIVIIALFYGESLSPASLLLAIVPVAAFTVLVQRRVTAPYLLVPLALVAWLFVHESGVHATITGVVLGLAVPVRRPWQSGRCLATEIEHTWRPVSAGLAIPVFAFFSAGVDLRGDGLQATVADAAAIAVAVALVVGKPAGVLGASWLVTRVTRVSLNPDISWRDLTGLSLLTGIGFTVSLLIAELAFADETTIEHARGGVIFGSLIAAIAAVTVLVGRNRHYRRLEARDTSAGSTAGVDTTSPPDATKGHDGEPVDRPGPGDGPPLPPEPRLPAERDVRNGGDATT